MVVVVWVVVFRTPPGLRLRSAGENPLAAETAGLSVVKTRYAAVVLSGVLAATGGAYLSIGFVHSFSQNMTIGKGFIALAALIFGRWRPGGALAAALLFGFSSALAQRLPVFSPSAATLFQALPYVLTLIAVAGVIGRSIPPAALGPAAGPQLIRPAPGCEHPFMTRVAPLLCVLVLSLAGCGGGGDDANDRLTLTTPKAAKPKATETPSAEKGGKSAGPVTAAEKRVIRQWSDALRRGDVDRAVELLDRPRDRRQRRPAGPPAHPRRDPPVERLADLRREAPGGRARRQVRRRHVRAYES